MSKHAPLLSRWCLCSRRSQRLLPWAC